MICQLEQCGDPFNAQALDQLYATISSADGVTVAELRSHVAAFNIRPRSKEHIQAYREGQNPWKKLRDEVVPIERFLVGRYPDDARVRFPLDDQPPDAWLNLEHTNSPIGIEVTGALARAGIEVGKSLAEQRAVPGFIALQDDAPSAEFSRVRNRARVTHTPESIDRAIDEALAKRLAAKDVPKFAGYILLITAPLHSAPHRSPVALKAVHGDAAERLPFSKIFVVDSASSLHFVQLK